MSVVHHISKTFDSKYVIMGLFLLTSVNLQMNLNTESPQRHPNDNMLASFVTLTPESKSRGFRFPTEAERTNLLRNLSNLPVTSVNPLA